MLKNFIVNNFVFLGKYKRWLVAVKDSVSSARETYSQYQEDKFIWEILQKYDLTDSVYVDIGANHPTDISNTYLLYRNGLSGIVVEPNEELANLFRKFRKRDIPLMIGCSNIAAVLKFNVSKTPVMSSFSDDRELNVHKSFYLPVMPIDTALQSFRYKYINLLSIDVEGLNYEVLQGAVNTIRQSLLLCIESDTESDRKKIQDILGDDFEFLRQFHCNGIYINKHLKETLPAKK